MNQHGVVKTVRTRERLVGMAAQAPATSCSSAQISVCPSLKTNNHELCFGEQVTD